MEQESFTRSAIHHLTNWTWRISARLLVWIGVGHWLRKRVSRRSAQQIVDFQRWILLCRTYVAGKEHPMVLQQMIPFQSLVWTAAVSQAHQLIVKPGANHGQGIGQLRRSNPLKLTRPSLQLRQRWPGSDLRLPIYYRNLDCETAQPFASNYHRRESGSLSEAT